MSVGSGAVGEARNVGREPVSSSSAAAAAAAEGLEEGAGCDCCCFDSFLGMVRVGDLDGG